jgi:hypothetical protein
MPHPFFLLMGANMGANFFMLPSRRCLVPISG